MRTSSFDRPGLSWRCAGLAIALAFATTARGQEAPSDCSVAEFRALALDTHDPRTREERAKAWLDGNLRACNLAQLRALGSNRGAWLGVADTATLAGRIDGAIERRIRENPDEVKALFSPAPAPAASTQSVASGETPAAPRQRIVGPGTPAVVSGAAPTPVPVPVPVAVPVQPPGITTTPGASATTTAVPAAPSASTVAPAISTGAAPSPAAAAAPALPAAPPSRFTDAHRLAVREHYERSVVAGPCPPPLQARGEVCETVNAIRLWKVGDPLPVTANFQDVPASLGSLLSPLSTGLRPIRLGNDILLIDANRRVADAILDLGGPRTPGARGGPQPTR